MEAPALRCFLLEWQGAFCSNLNRMNAIPVDPEKYAHLVKCAAAIEFLERQGVCWRDAHKIETDWVIGDATEWAYSYKDDPLVDRILRHRSALSKTPAI